MLKAPIQHWSIVQHLSFAPCSVLSSLEQQFRWQMVYSYAIALLCVVLAVIWGWQAQRKRKTAPGSNVPLLAGSKPFVGHLLDVVANTDR